MFLKYGVLRLKEEKSHCKAIVGAQTTFVEFAYVIAGGKVPDVGEKSDIQQDVGNLKSGFGNFEAYVGGGSEQYAAFLGKVTHDTLSQVHGSCKKPLEENLRAINEKYLVK